MKTSTFIKLLAWCIIAFAVVELSFAAINASNTILNICGIILPAVFAFISYKTNFFINIKIKNR